MIKKQLSSIDRKKLSNLLGEILDTNSLTRALDRLESSIQRPLEKEILGP